MLIVHVDQVTINSQGEAFRLIDEQRVSQRQVMLASLVLIHERSSNRYYVAKNRMTGSHGWVNPWEAKGLMQSHIDSLSDEINDTESGTQADWFSRFSQSNRTISNRDMEDIRRVMSGGIGVSGRYYVNGRGE